MPETTAIDEAPTQCNATYPGDSDIRCIRFGGNCLIDWHIGILEHRNGFREIVEWGSAAHEYAKQFGWRDSYRLLP